MPHLRASSGRLMTVTSVGGVIGQPFNEAYCAAKFAVEGFMEALAPLAATVGVHVSVVEPGAVASDFIANVRVDREAMIQTAGPYAGALSAYLARTRSQFTNAAQSPADAAQRIVEALTADKPAFRVQTSGSAQQFVGLKLADLDGSAVLTTTGGWIE
jgi:short-subunit dehydrogenase